jgi:adenosylcobinamide-GDP ribazoletransferase
MHLKAFLTALQFLTILPVRTKHLVDDKTLQHSLIYYPIIGLIIMSVMTVVVVSLGMALFGYDTIASAWQFSESIITLGQSFEVWQVMVLAVITLIGWVVLTGALHLDGFADSVDALIAGHKVYVAAGDEKAHQQKRDKILNVMKDPNSGPMAVIALILLLLFKFCLITAVFVQSLQSFVYLSLILVSLVLARLFMAVVLLETPYAKANGLGKVLQSASKSKVYVSYAALVIALVLMLGNWLLLLFLGMAAIAIIFRQFCLASVGGVTGDLLGMQLEVYEVAALLLGLGLLRFWM